MKRIVDNKLFSTVVTSVVLTQAGKTRTMKLFFHAERVPTGDITFGLLT